MLNTLRLPIIKALDLPQDFELSQVTSSNNLQLHPTWRSFTTS